MVADAIQIQNLKQEIQLLRQQSWPPKYLTAVEGLPIYYASQDEVHAYYQQWQPLVERAQQLCQPFLQDESIDAVHLPSHLNLPLFFFSVDRIRINKTRAKESKTFRNTLTLLDKCGQFDDAEFHAMKAWMDHDDTAALVAHREFIDLRTYIFQHGSNDYTRTRFYVNGVVLGVESEFKLIDARDKPRKQRSDSYKDPLADNGVWKVFGKYR